MKIELNQASATFLEGSQVAGICVLNDPFKPYLHPLKTPNGHTVSQAITVDHRHHKGLMYALRCADMNFWEEDPGEASCGIEKILKIEIQGDALILDLLWEQEKGGKETYLEQRTISCRYLPERKAFLWTWKTHREALRDHRLIKSQWSIKLPDGRTVNYHGLGLRVPREWSWGEDKICGFEKDGKYISAEAACGTTGPEMTLWGKMDGFWSPPAASVTMRQNHGFGWFTLKGGFSYISAGPSNLEEQDIKTGQTFDETYEVEVADRP